VTSHKRRKSRLCTVQEMPAAQGFLADLTPLCPHLGGRRRVTLSLWLLASSRATGPRLSSTRIDPSSIRGT
jgi:hypothetical protein